MSDVGISCWKDLFNIHRKRKEEFWKDFSKTIPELERIKLEKVLYRECCWDKDIYYYNVKEHICDDGTFKQRELDLEYDFFEIIKFEQIITKAHYQQVDNKDDFIKEKTVIDRIKRTFIDENHYVGIGKSEIRTSLDYYTLNKIFAQLRSCYIHGCFGNVIEESIRNNSYILTFADGTTKAYNYMHFDDKKEIYSFLEKILLNKVDYIKRSRNVPLDE